MPLRSCLAMPTGPGRGWLLPLLALVLAACGQTGASPEKKAGGLSSQRAALGETRIRLMGANISSGDSQSYDPGEGIRIFQGLKPDVAMIQEFNYRTNSDADIRSFVDTAFGKDFSYYRQAGVHIPNGVISRYPILNAGIWDDADVSDREFTWARIDIPGPKDLWVVSVHLLTRDSTVRNTEAGHLAGYIQANVPPGDFLAIGGDFNSNSRSPSDEPLFTAFSSVVSIAGPYPADRNNNVNTNASRAKPYDHVLVNSNLLPYQTATVVGLSSFSAGLVVDTRVYSPISEIAPALAEDSGATNMQHMAIVKDFLVPSDGGSTPMPTGRVTVVIPNGGESWVTNSMHSITWTASQVDQVKIEYTTDGSTWNTLSASTPANLGGLDWTVPAPASATVRVRVSDASNAAVNDTSDATFAIVTAPPSDTGAVITTETEGNGTAATANGRVGENKAVSGGVSSNSDVDWFRFTVSTAGRVKVKLTAAGAPAADLDWYVYTASDLSFSAASSTTANNPEVASFSATSPGTYYVKVVGYAGATGNYTLTVSNTVSGSGVVLP